MGQAETGRAPSTPPAPLHRGVIIYTKWSISIRRTVSLAWLGAFFGYIGPAGKGGLTRGGGEHHHVGHLAHIPALHYIVGGVDFFGQTRPQLSPWGPALEHDAQCHPPAHPCCSLRAVWGLEAREQPLNPPGVGSWGAAVWDQPQGGGIAGGASAGGQPGVQEGLARRNSAAMSAHKDSVIFSALR